MNIIQTIIEQLEGLGIEATLNILKVAVAGLSERQMANLVLSMAPKWVVVTEYMETGVRPFIGFPVPDHAEHIDGNMKDFSADLGKAIAWVTRHDSPLPGHEGTTDA